MRPQREALQQGVDMVVGTPGRLQEHVSAGTLDLSACHTAVLDEADVLLGDAAAFAEQVRARRVLPVLRSGALAYCWAVSRLCSWSV